jgi:putative peptide zinc metalloprotease protein
MTDPRTTPIPVAAPPAGEVLHRATGVELLGEVPGSGYRTPPALARRADGQVITLTPLLHAVLAAVDGRRSVAEVAAVVGEATGRLVRPEDVLVLADRSLRPHGLLRDAEGRDPEVGRANPLLALRLRRVVTDPALTRRITAPFAVLFHPLVVVPVVLAFAAVSFWVLFREGLAAATAQAFRFPSLFLAIVVVTVLSAGIHEFGHAAAARYGGATPGAMGFGLYLFWPAFYTNVTDSYRLGRAGRVRTDLGGLYFNALVVLVAFGVWWLTGWHAVLLVVATQILQMIRQLAPLLRFDGYHVLADVTGVPDLYQRIGPILRGLLPGRWRQPEATALRRWARVVVSAWVLVVVPLMLVSGLLMVMALPRLLGTAWVSVQTQAAQLGRDVGGGDILGVTARALAIVAVALPILGVALVLVRLVRRGVSAVARRTRGRPGRRAVAAVVAAALVVALGWTWWPSADRYRPVRPYEGGTVLDAVPAASHRLAGDPRGATTIWPDDGHPLPTADHPTLALLLTPAASDGTDPATGTTATAARGTAPTWVFPFDRPLPPGRGDNQALAVNTTDGSVHYDVSFALVWADGSRAVNRNEAYAFASCTGCRTVAVAFQVVLLVGSVPVVVPQNLSGAVNYACVQCVTYALAQQLVVSLPGPLSDKAATDLAAVWARVAEFARHLEDVPLSEIRDRLAGFESQILAVVRQDAGNGTAPAQESAADQTGADSTAPAGTGAAESTSADGGSGGATASTASTADGATAAPSGPAPATTEAPAATSAPESTGAAGTTAASTTG